MRLQSEEDQKGARSKVVDDGPWLLQLQHRRDLGVRPWKGGQWRAFADGQLVEP